MKKANSDIKKTIKEKNLKFWQVALKMGIPDTSFSKKLRVELSKSEKDVINKIIDALSKEATNDK